MDVLKGNRCAAKRQYEKLLGKALRGYGPSEHWAHAEYAWLLFEDGLRDAALHHLQVRFFTIYLFYLLIHKTPYYFKVVMCDASMHHLWGGACVCHVLFCNCLFYCLQLNPGQLLQYRSSRFVVCDMGVCWVCCS